MLWVLSGDTAQELVFFGQPGITSFTIKRKRGTGAWTAFTTPTISEQDTTNAPGCYTLLLSQDMTISTGKTTEQMSFYIAGVGMAPRMEKIVLYKDVQVNTKKFNDATVLGDGTSGNLWRG